MTEIRGAATRAEKKPGYFSGRANRKEYWFSIGLIFALSIVLSFFIPDFAGSGTTAAIVFAQIRRLHDLGRTGWWSMAAQGAAIAVMMVVWPLSSMEVGVLAGTAVAFAFLIWGGCMRGDPDENRFGKPPTKLFATA